MTTIQQLASITAQHNEIVKRVRNGSLDVHSVRSGLQAIIEDKAVSVVESTGLAVTKAGQPKSPIWYVSPERQLVRARQLWPASVLPEVPEQFAPQSKTEVLLLHVPSSFDDLWDKVNPPAGCTKWRTDIVKSGRRSLRLAPNVPDRTDPVWLGFDPEYGRGKRPDTLWGQPSLAASEVVSALIQFPDWCLAWFNGAAAPNLSGYQLKYGTGWSYVPCVDRWGDSWQLELSACWADGADSSWASPSVRVC